MTNPTRPTRARPVNIRVYDVETEELDQIRKIDLNDHQARDWLFNKLLYWAVCNHKAVEIVAAVDDQLNDEERGLLYQFEFVPST